MQTSGAEQALAEVERLGRIVEGLLSLARADAGASRTERVDLDAVIAERVALWTGVAVAGEHGLAVRSSADRLGQILDNLVANATAVSGDVTVSTRRVGEWVELHVVDRGPGLSAEDRRRAFDRFWRGHSAAPGSGLGLSIVRRLVTADGGEAELREAAGGGIDAVVRLRPG